MSEKNIEGKTFKQFIDEHALYGTQSISLGISLLDRWRNIYQNILEALSVCEEITGPREIADKRLDPVSTTTFGRLYDITQRVERSSLLLVRYLCHIRERLE